MGGTSEFFAYREKILSLIVKDDLLMRAIGNKSEFALALPTPSPTDLLYKNIFPYKRNSDFIETDAEIFLMFDLAASGTDNSGFFNDISIKFYVLSDESLDRIDKSGQTVLRTDYILFRLEEIFKSSRKFGIGKLVLNGISPIQNPPINYMGEAMVFSTVEFG